MTGSPRAVAAAAACLIIVCLSLLTAAPARAVLDVEDRGPVLDAGNFRMRVTNIGVLGNAFYGTSRSSDPSFEYPAYSGIEMLNRAELWVGAIDEDGEKRVSGGPMLEWRPTIDPADHVYLRRRADLGARRGLDDDGDGKVDEELLNGRDDDGDGEIDEDLGLFADQDAGCDYMDDRPEAVNFGYPTGESHYPLGLRVHQTASAWSFPRYGGVCVVNFQITNQGTRVLRDLQLGLFADLDSRYRDDPPGHRNDRVTFRSYTASKFEGYSRAVNNGRIPCGAPGICPPVACFTNFSGQFAAVTDGVQNSGLPAIGVVGIDHTVDPLTRLNASWGRAPINVAFRTSVFSGEGIPGQGGVPALDPDRYDALAGRFVGEATTRTTDWATLTSCGPFRELRPGQSLEFTVALVAGATPDSIAALLPQLILLHHGVQVDLLPNETARPDTAEYSIGTSGVSGHEICLEPPSGITFTLDKDCASKYPEIEGVSPNPVLYVPGTCVWTDLDCNQCTGLNGKETTVHWLDPGQVPPAPERRVTPQDHRVVVEWDNLPELLAAAGQVGGPSTSFIGYRLYKLASWRNRAALLPPLENWELIGTYGSESGNGEEPLTAVLDSTVDYDRILYEQKHYPIGRYRYVDTEVLNGFEYVYAVTSIFNVAVPVGDTPSAGYVRTRLESPLIASFDQRVGPHTAAVPGGKQVTVVPNPFRAAASWDRPPTFGDPLPRHIDFMHLPAALATIKIYTLAGDFVAQIQHDGRSGDGQASWDLISRNGQDCESGIYLFTVDSALGHQVGKFVVIR